MRKIDLSDRVAIVTGAAHGLGRAHALMLAERGAKVVVNDLGASTDGTNSNSAAAEAVAAVIKQAGGTAIADPNDVSTNAGTRALYDHAIAEFGKVDILVLNAGFLRDALFQQATIEDLDAVVRVHLLGPMYLAHHAFPAMREQRYGRIIFTTSVSGVYGNIGQAGYATAKAGVMGLMQTLAMEGASYNVFANAIMPLAISRMSEETMSPQMAAAAQPEHVAAMMTYLVSEQNRLNGLAVSSGAGLYAAIHPVEAKGVHFDPYRSITPEQIAAHSDAIVDFQSPWKSGDFAGSFAHIRSRLDRGQFINQDSVAQP